MNQIIKVAETPEEIELCKSVRTKVFQQEQGISSELDFDGEDDACQHILALVDQKAVGTLRLKQIEPTTYKLQRMAVTNDQRGQGLGRLMVEKAEEHAKENGFEKIILSAQETAKGFYEKLGYEVVGDPYTEAGLPHVKMQKLL